MPLPTPHALGVRRFAAGATDAHGNPVDAWVDPIDWPVSGIAPGALDEPGQANRDLSLILHTVLAPVHANQPGPRDLVVYNGREFAVNGEVRDWTQGPWDHPLAGVVVELTRVEG